MSFLKKAEEKILNIKSEIFQTTKYVENKAERSILEIVHDLARLVYDLLDCKCCCGCSDHPANPGNQNNGGGATIPGNNGNDNNGGNGGQTPGTNPTGPILIPNLPKPNNPDSDGKPAVVKPIQQHTISFDNGNGTTNLPGGAKVPTDKKPGVTYPDSNNGNSSSDKKPVPSLVVSNPDKSASKIITKDDYDAEKPITPVNPSKSSS